MTSGPRPFRGFTLIELMTSMVIGSMVLLLAASMLGMSGDSYERVGGSVGSEREGRALISQLADDFSTGVFNKDGVIERSTSAWPADRLGFLNLQPSQAQTDGGRLGDLCAVNYYIKDLPISGRSVRCLMRGFRESKETFAALRADTVASLFGVAADPDADEPVAFGVVSFEARPKSRDATGKWTDWLKNDTVGPEAFEVKLVVARRDLAMRLKTSADWDGAGGVGKTLGDPSQADRSKDLEIYGATIRFGNHAKP